VSLDSTYKFATFFYGFTRALGQAHFLTSLACSVGLCGLAMCVAVKRWLFIY